MIIRFAAVFAAVILFFNAVPAHTFSGPIVVADNSSNGTHENIGKTQNNRKVDVLMIPLGNAVVLGSSSAPKKVIVFTDPDCPFCSRLHREMKKVVEARKDIAFYIKLFPLAAHKDAYWKANAIECKKSLTMMEDNFEGRPITKDNCGTKEIDDNIKLAQSLGVLGTPTLILPDGTVHEGA